MNSLATVHRGDVYCGHLYTVDKTRLGKLIGQLPATLMAKVDKSLAYSLELP